MHRLIDSSIDARTPCVYAMHAREAQCVRTAISEIGYFCAALSLIRVCRMPDTKAAAAGEKPFTAGGAQLQLCTGIGTSRDSAAAPAARAPEPEAFAAPFGEAS